MSQVWSRVVSVLIQGGLWGALLTFSSETHKSKAKVIWKSFELDTNASQACTFNFCYNEEFNRKEQTEKFRPTAYGLGLAIKVCHLVLWWVLIVLSICTKWPCWFFCSKLKIDINIGTVSSDNFSSRAARTMFMQNLVEPNWILWYIRTQTCPD